MKLRLGFVSNSSSSSYVINAMYLSQEELDNIKLYCREDLNVSECFDNEGTKELTIKTYDNAGALVEFLLDLNLRTKAFRYPWVSL